MSKASEPFEPLISHWKAFRRPSANRVASIVPIAPHAATLEDGYRAAEVADAILRSAASGRRETINYS